MDERLNPGASSQGASVSQLPPDERAASDILDGAPLIDRIHPDLGDWDIAQGATDLLLALNGRRGIPQKKIAEMALQVACLLLAKNERYGDAALSPMRVFAKGLSPIDLIHVRMDDKISRLVRGERHDDGESPVFDLVGYGILEMIAQWEQEHAQG